MHSGHFSHIACILDLLNDDECAAPHGLLDIVREPIRQGSGLDVGYMPPNAKTLGLNAGFELERFRELGARSFPAQADLWAASLHAMPAAATDYLFSHVPEGSLILSSESPPWLRQACRDRQLDLLDLRVSPLQFGRDAHIAVGATGSTLGLRIAPFRITEEELRLEAAFLGANLRLHRHRLEAQKRYRFDLDGCLVFVGQHPSDPALIGRDGRFLRCTDFADRLRELAKGRRVLHLAAFEDSHEFRFADQERKALSDLLGVSVAPCRQSTYQVLSAADDVVLTGISAPTLQEAAWFGKVAHLLGEPASALPGVDGAANDDHEIYLPVRFADLTAPVFWHALLAPHAPAPKLARLPALDRHHARETLDAWSEYEKVLTWNRPLALGAFERSGGGALRQRLHALEQAHAAGRPVSATGGKGDDGIATRIERLKDSKQGQTAYILGNAPSLRELDIGELMQRESFWCNAAFKLEELGVSFRPKYYVLSDWWAFQRWREDILQIQAGLKFLPRNVWSEMLKTSPETAENEDIIAYDLRNGTGDPLHDYMFSNRENFSYAPTEGVFGGGSVVLIAIQFAFYMGYSKVLVGGVDLDYTGTHTHFYRGRLDSADQAVAHERTERIRRSFITAKSHFEKNGRTLAKITASPNLPLDFFTEHSQG